MTLLADPHRLSVCCQKKKKYAQNFVLWGLSVFFWDLIIASCGDLGLWASLETPEGQTTGNYARLQRAWLFLLLLVAGHISYKVLGGKEKNTFLKSVLIRPCSNLHVMICKCGSQMVKMCFLVYCHLHSRPGKLSALWCRRWARDEFHVMLEVCVGSSVTHLESWIVEVLSQAANTPLMNDAESDLFFKHCNSINFMWSNFCCVDDFNFMNKKI